MIAVTGTQFGTVDIAGPSGEDGSVAYASYGPEDAPAVMVLGGISAHRFVCGDEDGMAGWWPGVVGPETPLAPGPYRILGVDYIGGAGGSSGPKNGPGIPVVTTEDQANGVNAVLDHLGIEKLHAFIGASYGGMVGLVLGALHPDRLSRLLVCCAAHRSHPMATGLRALQRRIVELAADAGRESEGLALARELAMTTYRTPEEFEKRFVSVPIWEGGSPSFAVEKYLRVQGERFVRRFDGRAFAILSQSLDLHDVDPALIDVPTTVVSIDSDTLVPPWLIAEMVRRLPGTGRTIRITSNFGHDAFLKERTAVGRVIRHVLSEKVPG
jgi:homoserine O-acetyltransferase/O-succinyltransferase